MFSPHIMGSEDVDVQCHQQTATVNESCDSTTIGIATIPYSLTDPSGQQMSIAHSQAGTPTPATGGGTAIFTQTAASHTPPQNVAVQPSVPPSPLPHVQVIQQPIQNQYLQHLYAPQQQHMFLPGNLTIQPAIQSIGAPGLSLQLQGKPLDNKTAGPAIISASPMQAAGNFSGQNLMSAGGQMITAGAKTCVQGQMLTASSKSTAVIQGQSTFIPSTTANQTVVIGQLGVLANQPSLIPHQAKALTDSQKNKSFLISQPAALHPKSPILPSPNVSCAGQMVASNQIKQIQSAPHIISSQAPTMIASQAQILGSFQALGASLPQGITWATPGSLHSPALFGQNPIFIRSQQSDMFIQTPPPQATIHAVPVAAAPAPPAQAAPAPPTATAVATAPVAVPTPAQTVSPATAVAATSTPPTIAVVQQAVTPQPQKIKPVRPASSVATQTAVSTMASANLHPSLTKSVAKQRPRSQTSRTSPALNSSTTQLQTATTQTQTQLPSSSHKTDASNQTTSKVVHEAKTPLTVNKSSSTDTRFIQEIKHEKSIITQEVKPTSISTTTSEIPSVGTTTSVETEETNMDVEETEESASFIKNENCQKEREPEPVEVVAPFPETIIKDKQPQKAIVKPHVLTHVIEGFVIQEGSEPFPVGRPLMQSSITAKNNLLKSAIGISSPIPSTNNDLPPKKKEKIPKVRGPIELAKCEHCGKLGPKAKFKRSKRFCSTSCAKRFNLGSKRHSSTLSESDHKNSVSAKSTKKKKLSFKKKGWRKSQSRSYEISKWVPPVESPPSDDVNSTVPETKPEEIVPENGTLESNDDVNPESSMTPQMEEENEPTPSTLEFSTKPPVKWTVIDVVDFVRNLPGCSDYADEFRAQEIDGQALLLLKEDHLMSTMSMKLGPALKMCARINSLRDEVYH